MSGPGRAVGAVGAVGADEGHVAAQRPLEQESAAVQLIDVTKDASVPLPPLAADEAQMRHIEDIRYLKARIDGLLAMCSEPPASTDDGPVELDRVRADLEELQGLAGGAEE